MSNVSFDEFLQRPGFYIFEKFFLSDLVSFGWYCSSYTRKIYAKDIHEIL